MDGIAIGIGIALFGYFLGVGLTNIADAVLPAAKALTEEWRFYSRVLGRFELPPPPAPPPVDERAKKMETWLSKQEMSEEERENLLAMFEGVAGLRPASDVEVETWRKRLSAIGAPLPS